MMVKSKNIYSLRATLGAIVIVLTCLYLSSSSISHAQEATSTPALVNIAPLVPEPVTVQEQATPTLPPTNAPISLVRLEAKEFANVRAEPSTDAAQLGTVRAGETYTVIGQYLSWFQFQFPSAPSGIGWVYGELVNITGDLQTVPQIDPFGQAAATQPSSDEATLGVLLLTPGGILTATVQGASSVNLTPGAVDLVPGNAVILPTYTYPPGIIALAPTQASTETLIIEIDPVSGAAAVATAPIVPILVLGGIGLLGLMLNSLRRS